MSKRVRSPDTTTSFLYPSLSSSSSLSSLPRPSLRPSPVRPTATAAATAKEDQRKQAVDRLRKRSISASQSQPPKPLFSTLSSSTNNNDDHRKRQRAVFERVNATNIDSQLQQQAQQAAQRQPPHPPSQSPPPSHLPIPFPQLFSQRRGSARTPLGDISNTLETTRTRTNKPFTYSPVLFNSPESVADSLSLSLTDSEQVEEHQIPPSTKQSAHYKKRSPPPIKTTKAASSSRSTSTALDVLSLAASTSKKYNLRERKKSGSKMSGKCTNITGL